MHLPLSVMDAVSLSKFPLENVARAQDCHYSFLNSLGLERIRRIVENSNAARSSKNIVTAEAWPTQKTQPRPKSSRQIRFHSVDFPPA
jgi:hypothetical protein